MGSLFGKPKEKNPESSHRKQPTQLQTTARSKSAAGVEITSKDRAVLDLKNARDKLRRFRGQLEKDSQKLEGQVKTLIALKQKNRALLLLKMKKVKENELEQLDAKLLNVYSMIQSVEWASINVTVISAIESGTCELKRIHEERSLDDVEALMAETEDAIEMENKISQLLTGQTTETEDEDLSKELELLMAACAPNNDSENVKVGVMEIPSKELSKDATVDNVVKPIPLSLPPRVPEIQTHESLSFPNVPQTPILPITTTPSTAKQHVSTTERQPMLS